MKCVACEANSCSLHGRDNGFKLPPDQVPMVAVQKIASEKLDELKAIRSTSLASFMKKLEAMPVYALQGLLREMGLPVSGLKADLIKRVAVNFDNSKRI